MPITSSWYDDKKTLIYAQFEGYWDLNDYFQMVETNGKMVETQAHTVNIILDLRPTLTRPLNLLSAARHVEKKWPENQGVVCVVGANQYLKSIVGIARRFAPKAVGQTYFMSTMDEAFSFINEHSPEAEIYEMT